MKYLVVEVLHNHHTAMASDMGLVIPANTLAELEVILRAVKREDDKGSVVSHIARIHEYVDGTFVKRMPFWEAD